MQGFAVAMGRRHANGRNSPYITREPLHDWPEEAAPFFAACSITLAQWRRHWDCAIRPHATAGLFEVKQQTPRILDQMVLE